MANKLLNRNRTVLVAEKNLNNKWLAEKLDKDPIRLKWVLIPFNQASNSL